jgi:prefoldin subunit 5
MATLRGTVEDEQRIDKQIERLETSICQLAERVDELTEALEKIRTWCLKSDDDLLRHLATIANLALRDGRSK